MATVSFTAPASNGGSLITGYQVTSSPEGITANGVASPILVSGLTNGISYTFTVRAENAAGFGPDSAPSNAVTPQASQTITFANPGAQIQFTTPTLTASASSGLPVAFASTTPGVCSISSAGQLTLSTPGICTIEASQSGSAAYLPASPVSQSFEVLIPLPIATDSAVSVPFNSVGNVIPAVLSGGPATNLILVTGPANGALAVGGGLTSNYTPTTGFFGTDSFSYFAINSTGNSNTATVTITVLPPTPAITPSTLSAGRVASPYSASFTTTAGSFPFTVTVTDGASGSTASVDVTLQIDEQIPIAGNNTIIVAANSADNPVTLNLSGGAATAVNVTTPPANGTVTVTGTTVTYTPTAGFSGTDFFFYTASNAGGTSSEGVIGIQISPPILSISPSVLPQARVGVPYFVVLTGDLGTAPYNFRFSGGGLPAGITLAPDGTLSGTPLGAGVVPFAVNVFDALGAMGGALPDRGEFQPDGGGQCRGHARAAGTVGRAGRYDHRHLAATAWHGDSQRGLGHLHADTGLFRDGQLCLYRRQHRRDLGRSHGQHHGHTAGADRGAVDAAVGAGGHGLIGHLHRRPRNRALQLCGDIGHAARRADAGRRWHADGHANGGPLPSP